MRYPQSHTSANISTNIKQSQTPLVTLCAHQLRRRGIDTTQRASLSLTRRESVVERVKTSGKRDRRQRRRQFDSGAATWSLSVEKLSGREGEGAPGTCGATLRPPRAPLTGVSHV